MKEGDEMTNKEAIELLSEVDRKANENGEDGDGFVALKIAIEALKREDHDGCDGCEHEPKDEFTFPCVICKQNFVDMYEQTPERKPQDDFDEMIFSLDKYMAFIDCKKEIHILRKGARTVTIDRTFNTEEDAE